MAYRIVILPLAKLDIQSVADWYEEKETGLGKRFRKQIVITIDNLLHPLKGYGTVYISLSRVFIEKFPYIIYFKQAEIRQRLAIYTVLHIKQDRSEILKQRI